jgi:hypothetical protein
MANSAWCAQIVDSEMCIAISTIAHTLIFAFAAQGVLQPLAIWSTPRM